MRKTKLTWISYVIILVIIPALLVASIFSGNRKYSLLSTAIVILGIISFFFVFEKRKPQLYELVTISVLCAIAIAGRMAFAFLPQFKPVFAVVIIAALSFGAETGFLAGALSMLLSNFYFGQGPWTPWQMFACGLIGFIAGLLANRKFFRNRWVLAGFGFFSGFLYGIIVDVWSVIGFIQLEKGAIMGVLISGLPFSAALGIATGFFLFILEKPMTKKLNRIKNKYGMMNI